MDTQDRNQEPKRRRPPQNGTKRRPAPQNNARRKAPAKSPVARRKAIQAVNRSKAIQAGNRSKREDTARASKIKAMKQDVEKKAKRRVRKPRRPMQPVVYTQPKVFNRSRLMVQLISIMAIVMALILGLSIFFRVKTITVSGANAYSAWAVREASGIEEGDYLLTFSRARATARIEAELPYVYSARIGIKLPDTVNIVIEEIDVVYAIQCQDGIWWLMTSTGEIMEQTDAGEAGNYTKVLGVVLASPVIGEQAVAYQNEPTSTEASGETEETLVAPVTVTEQQKLNAALQILQALELNEEVGTAASVDVTDLTRIELWYGTRYQVNLGNTDRMDYKIASMKATIQELSDYETGMLDCSFVTWTEEVGYTPFE